MPVRKRLERFQRKVPYYLAGCDRKSAGAGHRLWVMPEEEKIVYDPEGNWFHVAEIVTIVLIISA